MVSEDRAIGCGVSPFITGEGDPFFNACEWHDKAYTKDSWAEHQMTRDEVDRFFLNQMLLIAGEDTLLKARAYLYYDIVRFFGCRWWEGGV